jgi:hypothetical protein
MKLKSPILYPVTDFSPYFKIYVLENSYVIKHEVDWIYSTFETKYCQEFKCHIKECDCYFIPLKPRKV